MGVGIPQSQSPSSPVHANRAQTLLTRSLIIPPLKKPQLLRLSHYISTGIKVCSKTQGDEAGGGRKRRVRWLIFELRNDFQADTRQRPPTAAQLTSHSGQKRRRGGVSSPSRAEAVRTRVHHQPSQPLFPSAGLQQHFCQGTGLWPSSPWALKAPCQAERWLASPWAAGQGPVTTMVPSGYPPEAHGQERSAPGCRTPWTSIVRPKPGLQALLSPLPSPWPADPGP